MGSKVTFDPTTRIIQVDDAPVGGVVELDVKIDLYSDGKEDWVSDVDLIKYAFPIRSVGGDPLPGDKALGATFFLDSTWKIRPYEGDHRLLVNGNLYSEDGTSPFTQTVGNYNVMVEITVSSLVDSTVVQQSEIERMAFGNVVTIDVVNGVAGTDYDIGTNNNPSNNITDAKLIAIREGFNTLYIKGNITLSETDVVDNLKIEGQGQGFTVLTATSGCSCSSTEFTNLSIQGTLGSGEQFVMFCNILNLTDFSGFMNQCLLNGTIILNGSNPVNFVYCSCGLPGGSSAIIDMGGSGRDLNVRNYSGCLAIKNLTANQNVELDFISGELTIEATVTAGTFDIRGVVIPENLGTPTLINASGIVNADIIKHNKEGNKKYEYVEATEQNVTRKVEIGELDHIIIKIKNDNDSDWSSPVSTQTLYTWYAVPGDSNPIYIGESD